MLHNRPISPHLQIYTLPLTGVISISHRLTGVFLAVGLIGFVFMLAQVKYGMLTYLQMQTLLQMLPMKLLISGFVYALVFHFCHGIRHLIWDVGHGFSRETLTRYALMELCAAFVLRIFILAVLL